MSTQRWTLLAVCMATFMLLLDITIVNVALPNIQRELDASFSDLQWVVDAYSLMLASRPAHGRLARGPASGASACSRSAWSCSASRSLLCGLASEPTSLNLARGFQGSAARSCSPAPAGAARPGVRGARARQRLRHLGRDDRRGRGHRAARGRSAHRVARLGVDLLRERADRRAHGHGGACCALHEHRPEQRSRIDWAGVVTFSGGLFCLVFALIRGNAEGWGSALILGLLVASVAPARGVRGRGAARKAADARPQAVPQAGVHRRPDHGVRDLGVDVLDVPLPHALRAERARLLAAPSRAALPAGVRALVRGGADRRPPDRPRADPGAPVRRSRGRGHRAPPDARRHALARSGPPCSPGSAWPGSAWAS